MEKHLLAGLLMLTLHFPALATPHAAQPSDQHVRFRAVLLCMAVVLGLRAIKPRILP